MKRLIWAAFVFVLGFIQAGGVLADEFDFMMKTQSCKMTVAFQKIHENALQTVDADEMLFFCSRSGTEMACQISYPGTSAPKVTNKYSIKLDSPPKFMFMTENGSELVYVDTVEMAGSYTSRVLSEGALGYKVCSVVFATKNQVDALMVK